MVRVIWTEPALHDLNEIAEYIALDKISAAKKLIQQVFSSTEHLEKSPKLGRKPPELNNSRYLELIVNPCRIFHRVEKECVYILFVMSSERKLSDYILEDRLSEIS